MEYQSRRKHIANWFTFSLQIFYIDYFGGHISRSAASDEKVFVLIGPSSQPKISNDDLIVIAIPKEYVFGLEIPMHDPLIVHTLQP